jgi:recombination DNA repair RAD52 pathway protein
MESKTTNLQAKKTLDAIKSIDALTIDDLDTALAIVDNEEVLSNEFKRIGKAIEKIVGYTDEEKEYMTKVDRIVKSANSENEKEKFKELNALADNNKALVDSINDKQEKEQEKHIELSEKTFDVTKLTKIDKNKLMKTKKVDEKEVVVNTLTNKQLAGLRLIFK